MHFFNRVCLVSISILNFTCKKKEIQEIQVLTHAILLLSRFKHRPLRHLAGELAKRAKVSSPNPSLGLALV